MHCACLQLYYADNEFSCAFYRQIVFYEPDKAFWVQVKLALFVGLYCSLPFLFYQIWKFVDIGLKQNERKYVLPLSIASFILFTLGGAFCYFFVICKNAFSLNLVFDINERLSQSSAPSILALISALNVAVISIIW